MNLLLSPLENVNDPVWSVIICVLIAVGLALGYVVYILNMSYIEISDGKNDTTEQEELLQLPSDGD
jgi:hypothetical protein